MKKLEYFLAGIFAALGALLLEIILDFFHPQSNFFDLALFSLVLFAAVEELAKFWTIQRKISLADPLATILANCLWVGLGFGLLEWSILLLDEKAVYAGNTPAILAVISVHVITAGLTGVALAKLKSSGYYAVLAAVPALLFHLAFNYWILTR